MVSFTFYGTKSLMLLCVLEHISIWTDHILSTQLPHLNNGSCIGLCYSKTLESWIGNLFGPTKLFYLFSWLKNFSLANVLALCR